MNGPRTLDWQRFTGAFANAVKGAASSSSVIGVAPDICSCCDEKYVVIAAVHADGHEVSVSLSPEVALEVAQRIVDSYQLVSGTPTKVRQ